MFFVDRSSLPRVVETKLADKKELFNDKKSKWESQRELLGHLKQTRAQIEEQQTKLEIAERELKLDEAAKIKYGQIPDLEKKLKQNQTKWDQIPEKEKQIFKP